LSSHEQDGTRTDLSVVWAPTQDGGFYALKTELYLPEMPHDMRQQGNFERVPAIIGINAQDGAEVASMYPVVLHYVCIYTISNIGQPSSVMDSRPIVNY